jgi:hypothetical protein
MPRFLCRFRAAENFFARTRSALVEMLIVETAYTPPPLVGHAVADYPLQGDFLAWTQALAAHALIHAGAVALATGSAALGVPEFACHAAIDYANAAAMWAL